MAVTQGGGMGIQNRNTRLYRAGHERVVWIKAGHKLSRAFAVGLRPSYSSSLAGVVDDS